MPDDCLDLVRRRLVAEHAELLTAAGRCADAVAADWPPGGVRERERVVPPLRTALAAAEVTERLPELLLAAVDVLGAGLAADPVPGPPYVVIASTGPVLRGTLADGADRLVIELGLFEVEGTPPTYRRTGASPLETLTVTRRERP